MSSMIEGLILLIGNKMVQVPPFAIQNEIMVISFGDCVTVNICI